MSPSQPKPVIGSILSGRRAFLVGAAATAGLALLDPVGLAAARRSAAALPAGDLFPLGVASGDPTADGVVLWTRLLAPDEADPLPSADVAVEWEVATDGSFADVVASGTAAAVAALAHSVHVEVNGLQPGTEYHYRFVVDGRSSPAGRTRTFPGVGVTPDSTTFALASCQNYADGYYTAYGAMVGDGIEFVVFVGDYIYESSANRGPRPLTLPTSRDLATYRARYELYKRDEHLKAAHAAVPWIITMDDHEVANNVLGDLGMDGAETDSASNAAFMARRADSFQVWYEHLPVRLAAPSGPSYRIHRVVDHSDLLRFHVLDGRQYRSPYPGDDSQGLDDPARHDEGRSMLGAEQEAWLNDELASSDARWNVIAQQTVFTNMPIPAGTSTFFNFDQWDGYTANRRRIVEALVANEVPNPMVLSGDIHLAAAAGIRLDWESADAPDVAHEIVTTSISSRFDPALLDLVEGAVKSIPWARYGNASDRGYALITVTPDAWTTQFRVTDTQSPNATTARTDHTDVVDAREPGQLAPSPPRGDGSGDRPARPAEPVSANPSYTG